MENPDTIKLQKFVLWENSKIFLPGNTVSYESVGAEFGGRAVQDMGLWPLDFWDYGFESQRGHGCLTLVSFVCCQWEVSASGWSLVQRSPIDCDVAECDRESIMRRLWSTRGSCAMGGVGGIVCEAEHWDILNWSKHCDKLTYIKEVNFLYISCRICWKTKETAEKPLQISRNRRREEERGITK